MAKRLQNNLIPGPQKYTIADFNCEFPDDDACLTHIFEARWPNGITTCDSKKCGNVDRKHHRVTGRTAYACDYCGKHIYPLAGKPRISMLASVAALAVRSIRRLLSSAW